MKRIAEIDRKLDMMVTISVQPRHKWFQITENFEWRYPGRVLEESGRKVFQIFLQKNLISQKDLSILTFMPNLVTRNNYYTASFDFKDTKNIDLLLSMLEIPSVVLSENYIYKGKAFYTFRYHNSAMKQVSDALQVLFEDGRCKLVYLGKSAGIMAILNEASKHVQLSMVKIVKPSPTGAALLDDISNFDLISELETRQMKAQGAKLILYYDSHLTWAKTVSEEDGIYELPINDLATFELNKMAYDARLPVIGSFSTGKGDSLEITMFLPTYCLNEFLANFYKLITAPGKSNIYLNVSAPFTIEMWEWI